MVFLRMHTVSSCMAIVLRRRLESISSAAGKLSGIPGHVVSLTKPLPESNCSSQVMILGIHFSGVSGAFSWAI